MGSEVGSVWGGFVLSKLEIAGSVMGSMFNGFVYVLSLLVHIALFLRICLLHLRDIYKTGRYGRLVVSQIKPLGYDVQPS